MEDWTTLGRARRRLWPVWAVGFATVLAVAGSPPPSVEACSCVAPGDPATELIASAAVFLGRVESQERVAAQEFDTDGLVRYSMTIDRAWKGVTSPSVSVVTPHRGIDCTDPLAVGETYVLYAHRIVPRTTHVDYMIGLCSRSAHESEASQDLAYLAGVEPSYVPPELESLPLPVQSAITGRPSRSHAIGAMLAVLAVGLVGGWAFSGIKPTESPRPRQR